MGVGMKLLGHRRIGDMATSSRCQIATELLQSWQVVLYFFFFLLFVSFSNYSGKSIAVLGVKPRGSAEATAQDRRFTNAAIKKELELILAS